MTWHRKAIIQARYIIKSAVTRACVVDIVSSHRLPLHGQARSGAEDQKPDIPVRSIPSQQPGPRAGAGSSWVGSGMLQVMRRLRGSLNVAQFRGAYEDADEVYITMEWCKGGELWHRIGRAHYSEQTVRPCAAACPGLAICARLPRSRHASARSAPLKVQRLN